MVLLPALVFGSKVKGSRVLEIGRQDHSLVTSLAGKLDTKIPGIESDEGEVKILRGQMLGCKGVEPVDSIAEGSCIPNMLPGESGQARCSRTISADVPGQC